MRALMQCLRKDCCEFVREKRNFLFSGTLAAIGSIVLLVTLVLPPLLDTVTTRTGMLIGENALSDLVIKFFPQDLKSSLGTFSTDVGIFYSLVVIIVACSLIPSELRAGKWVLPVSAGVKPSHMLLSKLLTYGTLSSAPTVVFYILYYFISSNFLAHNFSLLSALLNATTLAFCIFLITVISIAISVLCRNRVWAMLSMFMVVMGLPDVMTFFPFGRYMPTYLLTFAYTSGDSVYQILIPILASLVCLVATVVSAVRKISSIEFGNPTDA